MVNDYHDKQYIELKIIKLILCILYDYNYQRIPLIVVIFFYHKSSRLLEYSYITLCYY